MKHGQDLSIGLVGTLVFSIILIVGYHFALQKFAGYHFQVFNYKVTITKCGPVMHDRIKKLEKRK